MGNRTGYDLCSYGRMVICEPRMSAFAEALRRAVTPGCTVFDIGAGPGVFSLLACKYGAGKVVAIEPDDSVELLRTFAQANRYEQRIEIFDGLSSDYHPEERADVIVSDLRGRLPLFEAHIEAITDARDRLLAPGGTLIPARDTVRVALVQNAKDYSTLCEEPWVRNRFGLDLSAGHRFAVNLQAQIEQANTELLGEPADLWTLDYTQVSETNHSATVRLVADREGMAHGFLLWFDCELAPGIGFSNAPDQPQQVYRQVFHPLEQPCQVAPGDNVELEISARQIDGSYVWAWNSVVRQKGSEEPVASFRQSDFLGKVMSPSSLRLRASSFAPPRRADHEIDSAALSLVDGERTLGEIANSLRDQFPERFENAVDALNHVTRLTARYR